MPSYRPIVPSGGAADGTMTLVVATATAGTILHTAVSGTDDVDEVWVWAMNSDSTDRLLTIEFGGVTDPDDLIEMTIPSQDGLHLVVPGIRIHNGLVIRAFAAAASVVTCAVNVNRIYQNA